MKPNLVTTRQGRRNGCVGYAMLQKVSRMEQAEELELATPVE